MDWYDTLVVGGGLAGSIMAERLPPKDGQRVLVIDRHPHIAGNAFDYCDKPGVLVHKYDQPCVARRSSQTPGRRAVAMLRDGDVRPLAVKARSNVLRCRRS